MKLYIIVLTTWNIIESVWDTHDAARNAVEAHAREARISFTYYEIIERELNQLKGEK